jgi:uncharacterized membrane-anchored protein YhcB (DUF1043 family)
MHPSDFFRRVVLPAWLAVSVAVVAFIVGEVGGYLLHEHRMAQGATARQQQITAELKDVRTQLDELNGKMNALEAHLEPQSVSSSTAVETPAVHNATPTRRPTEENVKLRRMQSQLDQQGIVIDQQSKAIDQEGKAITDTQSQLESTRRDLSNTHAELTGSVARTHEELLLLQKKGERNYYEFDIAKSKQFQHDGPLGVRLRKADIKHQYADLDLIVEDKTVSQKHVNLYQTVMFHSADSTQPAELVINDISKDHIHGYVSSPKYRRSEFGTVPSANQSAQSKPGEQTAQQQTATPPQ